MNNTSAFIVTDDIPSGSSVIIPTQCGANTGPANVDGRCVLGGVEHVNPTGRACSAYPVYVLGNVPYTSGHVAGSNYSTLSKLYSYTKLNDTGL